MFLVIILVGILSWYFIVARYFADKPILSFSLYLIFLIILPNEIGFHYYIDHRLWQLLAIFFLLPHAFYLFQHKKIRFDRMDNGVLLLVLLGSIYTFIFVSGKSGVGVIYKGFLYIFLPYTAGKYFISNGRDFFKIINIINWGAIIVSIIALIEYNFGRGYLQGLPVMIDPDAWGASKIYQRYGQFRTVASFGHPIYLGTFLLLVATINIILLSYKKPHLKVIKSSYSLLQIVLAVIVVLISQARTAVVCLIPTVLIMLVIEVRKLGLGKIIKYAVLVLIIMVSILYIYFYDYMTEFLYYGVTSPQAISNLKGRALAISEGIRILKSEMNWFGESHRLYSGVWTLRNTELSNGFINILTLNGMFYFTIYIYIWLIAFKSAYKMRGINEIVGGILLFLLLFLFLVNNITQLNFQNALLFYIFVGFCLNKSLLVKNKSRSK